MGDSAAVEQALNAAADLIAATLAQPADPRAWDQLLIYCPPEAIERRRATQPATTGCICQEQHRRGYCTEHGCQFASSAGNEDLFSELAELGRLVSDGNVSDAAIGMRLRNTWPLYERGALAGTTQRSSGGDVVARANAGKQRIAAGSALTGTSEDTTQGDRPATTVKVRPPERTNDGKIEP